MESKAAGSSIRTATVVGGGIGGLATGVALVDAGLEVTVLERSNELRPLGAGLTIAPNGVLALRALGLERALSEAPRVGGALRRRDGAVLADFDPGVIETRYGAPLLGVHRADLQGALAEALGRDRLRLGVEVTALEGGTLRMSDGSSLSPDLIVGADGLHSVARKAILADGSAIDSGIVAYRGVATAASDPPAGEWWGSRGVAGLVPLGKGRVYWYLAYRGDPEADALDRRAAEFGQPVGDAIRGTREADVLCHRLYDRPPASRLTGGNVILVGDAAHPMLPFLGQGACCALEDAVAVRQAVASHGDVAAAAAAYDRMRARRSAMLVKRSRSAARVALAGSALGRAARNAAVRVAPSSLRLKQLDAVIGSPMAPSA